MGICEAIHRDGTFIKMVAYAELVYEDAITPEIKMKGMNLLRKHYEEAKKSLNNPHRLDPDEYRYGSAQMGIIEDTFKKHGLVL